MKKVALITGGTRGIGLGIAQNLALKGYSLALNGVREENDVKPIITELENKGVEVIYCQGNIGDSNDRESIIESIKLEYGQLNVLVNNAGIAPRERKDILETSEASYDEVMRVNLRGPYFLTQTVANWFVEQKEKNHEFRSSIINVSSISATVASVNRGEYCLSKAGISMMTQLFAVRMGEYNIPVYEVRPGLIQTDMTSGVKEKYDKLLEEGLCVFSRWGTPNDVGKAVALLAEGEMPYSTGQVIMVDGGMTIPRL
jgi:NAD(P)-dependent dehydrogenase (short-subunit alcohol dehydrogenase family)